MSEVAVRVENVGKKFLIGHRLEDNLRSSFSNKLSRLFGSSKGQSKEEFWALNDISFEVKKGEAVGIIGRNGAGKSTLLKILSRITDPTTGRFEINGRVSSLLEVGTGFHSELTGRENIYLNGTILGMRRTEIRKKFDAITDFSGVEKFIDTPVKHYSSGMKVRLAFSIAAHLEPEILIIDEVLAVGDSEFQKKCLGKMEDVSRSGRTILFVSHSMAAVENLCKWGLLLNAGGVICYDNMRKVIRNYQNLFEVNSISNYVSRDDRNEPAYFKSVEVILEGEQPECKLLLLCEIFSVEKHKDAFLAFDISNSIGIQVMQAIPKLDPFIKYSELPHIINVEILLPPLIPDVYKLSVWIGSHNTETISWDKDVLSFEITESPSKGRTYPHHHSRGFVVPISTIIEYKLQNV